MKPGTVPSWLSRPSQRASNAVSSPCFTLKRFIAMNIRSSPAQALAATTMISTL